MKIKICKCKGRKKVSGKWHDCGILFVQPFEKECPGGCARDHYVVREFVAEMPYLEVDNKLDCNICTATYKSYNEKPQCEDCKGVVNEIIK